MNVKIKVPVRSSRYRDTSSDPTFIQKHSKKRAPSHDRVILQAGRISDLLMKYVCLLFKTFPCPLLPGEKEP